MSIRGRSKLVLGGYQYSKYYAKYDITYWRCIDLKHCRAKATSQPMGLKHMAKLYGVHTCSWCEKPAKQLKLISKKSISKRRRLNKAFEAVNED